MASNTFAGLKALRESVDPPFSQRALSDAVGVRQATISEWENGGVVKIELSVIDSLCAVLGKKLKRTVTLDDLRRKPKQ